MIEIYLIEVNQSEITFYRSFDLHITHEEAEEVASRLLQTDVYDGISVKCVQIEEKYILIEFLKFLQQKNIIPPYSENLTTFIEKRGTVVWTQKIL